MNDLLIYYIVAKNCVDRLNRTIAFQRRVMPNWDNLNKVFIIEPDQDAPINGANVIRMKMFDGPYIMFSHLKNAAIKYAMDNHYKWLLDCDADTAILNMPTTLPVTGYGGMQCYMSQEGETEDQIIEKIRGRVAKFQGSSRFLLRSDALWKCKYYEGFKGYNGEDLDYHEVVLPAHGFHTSFTDMQCVHFWHPLNYRPYLDDALRQDRRRIRPAVEAASMIDGWMDPMELYWLADKAVPAKKIIEIGSWKGRSTKAISMATLGTVFAVDNWSGSISSEDPMSQEIGRMGKGFIRQTCMANLKPEIDAGRVQLLQVDSKDAAAQLAGIHGDVDFVFIDGGHDYATVSRDIETYLPFVKKGGIISGHDCIPGSDVHKAVSQRFPDFKWAVGSIWYKVV